MIAKSVNHSFGKFKLVKVEPDIYSLCAALKMLDRYAWMLKPLLDVPDLLISTDDGSNTKYLGDYIFNGSVNLYDPDNSRYHFETVVSNVEFAVKKNRGYVCLHVKETKPYGNYVMYVSVGDHPDYRTFVRKKIIDDVLLDLEKQDFNHTFEVS